MMNNENLADIKNSLKKMPGRIMALDIGTRKIGIALSDVNKIIASPHSTIILENVKKFKMEIKKIISDQQVIAIIYGIPYEMNGNLGISAENVEKIIMPLKSEFTLPFIGIDERLSTKFATKMLKDVGISRKKRDIIDDNVAASLMLQEFLRNL